MGCYFDYSDFSCCSTSVLTILVWFGMSVDCLVGVVVLSLLSFLMMGIFFC